MSTETEISRHPLTRRSRELLVTLAEATRAAGLANGARSARQPNLDRKPAPLLESERATFAVVASAAREVAEQALRLASMPGRGPEIAELVAGLENAEAFAGGVCSECPAGLGGALARGHVALRGALPSEAPCL